MKTTRRIFFISMLGNLACLLLPGCGRNSESDSNAGGPESAQSKEAERKEVIAYEQQNEANLEAAIQLKNQRQRLADAAAKTKDYRWGLQYANAAAWTKFISGHMSLFMTLRQEAARSSTGRVPCTICDGRGKTDFCPVCKNSGKCPTCSGTGLLLGGAICPSCQGNSKCFLCHGAGKMTCPFCIDGAVYADQPPPPDKIPIG